jgi:hypothetical protein
LEQKTQRMRLHLVEMTGLCWLGRLERLVEATILAGSTFAFKRKATQGDGCLSLLQEKKAEKTVSKWEVS